MRRAQREQPTKHNMTYGQFDAVLESATTGCGEHVDERQGLSAVSNGECAFAYFAQLLSKAIPELEVSFEHVRVHAAPQTNPHLFIVLYMSTAVYSGYGKS